MSNFYLITFIGPWPRPTPGRGGGVLPALPVMRLLQLVGGCHWVAVRRRGHWSGRAAQHSVFRRCGVATHATPICARSIIAVDIYVHVVKKAAEPLRRSARWPTQARAQPARPAPTLAWWIPRTRSLWKTNDDCTLPAGRMLGSGPAIRRRPVAAPSPPPPDRGGGGGRGACPPARLGPAVHQPFGGGRCSCGSGMQAMPAECSNGTEPGSEIRSESAEIRSLKD